MMNVIVLGIGNRLMRDDGIGVYVVEALQDQMTDQRIRFMAGETDIDYCLNVIAGAELLIIVDAAVSGNKAGEVALFPLDRFQAQDRGISAHNLHLLHMIPIVYPDVQTYVIGIEADQIDFGLEMSAALADQFQRIVKDTASFIYFCMHMYSVRSNKND
ncbi:hydrogenase maturation protease [Paenibacillus thiaminolyticus]|uniref:hydrogenase maturation protease n=1 Tax=Paenibacillus thiaminolyticus TaxID=49283 RepID=UPI00232C5F85|nr:hydrogenase maturation protease [Paenibacillus thiaminolyticus]WCF05841.1 hydrogenase maturation protease [Paenibacillus thiaminolyticus]